MMIEQGKITTSKEDGDYLTITGRSLEGFLGHRIIMEQTTLTGTVSDGIAEIINDALINPKIGFRKFDEFVLGDMGNFQDKLNNQYTGDTLLSVITSICKRFGLGFRISLKNNKFVFDIYKGENRSYGQNKNSYVIFSPQFDNLINSEYEFDTTQEKNFLLVAGEGEGFNRITVEVFSIVEGGWGVREMFVDARDVSSQVGEGDEATVLPYEEYRKLLLERGYEKQEEYRLIENFIGQVDTKLTYEYKKDYFVGDIVQMENEYRMKQAVRIVEVMETVDESGKYLELKFEKMGVI